HSRALAVQLRRCYGDQHSDEAHLAPENAADPIGATLAVSGVVLQGYAFTLFHHLSPFFLPSPDLSRRWLAAVLVAYANTIRSRGVCCSTARSVPQVHLTNTRCL